ncbi:MarR family winged helix-turn-helix transcriptional regulator [Streptomyces sp. NPDC059679]|uniref:MarR family winged helix-turn-helix transcriptional regulator n=1 Tax=Streptomyces sp. NPDC059679 TaxID=3346903 RepID=UPI0036A9A6F2
MDDNAVTAEELGLRFLALSHRVRRVVDDRMAAAGLSLARTKLLRILRELGPTRQSSLAEHLGFAARTVTETVDGLERDGLIERATDATDRRAKLVSLTRAGSAVLVTATQAGEQVLQEVFGSLGHEQRASMIQLCDLIDSAARTAAGPARPPRTTAQGVPHTA